MRTRKIYAVILEHGQKAKQFSPYDLPGLTSSQARRNCLALAAAGELRVVVKGNPGRKSCPAVYEFIPLRAAQQQATA